MLLGCFRLAVSFLGLTLLGQVFSSQRRSAFRWAVNCDLTIATELFRFLVHYVTNLFFFLCRRHCAPCPTALLFSHFCMTRIHDSSSCFCNVLLRRSFTRVVHPDGNKKSTLKQKERVNGERFLLCVSWEAAAIIVFFYIQRAVRERST